MRGALRDLSRRVMLAVARGVLARVEAGTMMQALQVKLLAGETKDNVEHFEPYGFTSHPHPGAELVTLFLGGGRDHGIVVMVADRRYRIRGLQQGELAVFTDEDQQEGGHRIVLKRGRKIEVAAAEVTVTATAKVTVTAPLIEHNPV